MSSSFSKASKSNSRLRRPKAVKQVSQLPQIEHAATQRSRQQNQTGGERTLLSGVASPRISSVVVSSKCAWHTVKHTVPSRSRKETKQAFEAPSFLPSSLACLLPSCLPSFFPFIFVDAFIFIMFDAFTFSFLNCSWRLQNLPCWLRKGKNWVAEAAEEGAGRQFRAEAAQIRGRSEKK